jgi:hypothetical protein
MQAEIMDGTIYLYPENPTELYAVKSVIQDSPENIIKVKDVKIDYAELTGYNLYD